MSELRLKGRSASPGFAAGPIVVIDKQVTARRERGTVSAEAEALKNAMIEAATDLRLLAERVRGEAKDMLGFQLALIEDDTLSEPAFMAIRDGAPADVAWRSALQTEIDEYEAADDAHFRARASDLKDLRDRVLNHLSGRDAGLNLPAGAILVADDLPPSRFLSMDWTLGGAILLSAGSALSHLAILARSRGIPMITGLPFNPASLSGEALVDAETAEVIVNPTMETLQLYNANRIAAAGQKSKTDPVLMRSAVTRDGVSIAVHINIAGLEELKPLDPSVCDGIGLVRTEFLFQGGGCLPGEDEQYETYKKIVQWAAGRPVTIRTLDAGGDKPVPGYTQDGESNPFLGMRGIRLSFIHRDVFRTQLRALIRASAHGQLKIMLPMVTVARELEEARTMLDREIDDFVKQGVAVRRPKLGIMVEVPAVATSIRDFPADFFSIGSNDLTQYATAAGRDIGSVTDFATPLHPGVLRMIEMVVRHGQKVTADVSLCGDAGSEPAFLPSLLRTGLRSISVSPSALRRTKALIAELDLSEASNVQASQARGVRR